MIADIIIIVLIGLSAFLGYKKGLTKLIFTLISLLVSIVVACFVYSYAAEFVINNTNIDETIENEIYKSELKILEENDASNAETINFLKSQIQDGTLKTSARTLAVNIVKIGVFIVLFIVIRVIMIFVSKFLDSITKMPALKQLNGIGGFAIGLVRGLLIVYVLLFAIQIYTQFSPSNYVEAQIETSSITKTMYENNILNLLIKE